MTDLKVDQMPPQLVEALVEKARAEARQADAQARHHHALARVFDIQAKDDELALVTTELGALSARLDLDRMRHSDTNSRVARLGGPITSESAGLLLSKVTSWARQSPNPIEVVISSSGGEILPGFALFDALTEIDAEQAPITTGCIGIAASMAGVLLQAGRHRWMGKRAHIMIHRAAFMAAGKAFEVEDQTEFVTKLERQVAQVYATRSQRDEEFFMGLFAQRKDVWISSDEALEWGLVDEVR